MEQREPRINASVVDGRVVIRVEGSELFDLVEDHMTARLSEDFLVRFPEAKTEKHHEIIFSPNVTLQEVNAALAELPKNEQLQAQAADDA